MKTMTCKQLGGACEKEFQANSFSELVEMSKQHGMEMFMNQDAGHLDAINKVQALMQKPEAMQAWLEEKQAEYNALPEDI